MESWREAVDERLGDRVVADPLIDRVGGRVAQLRVEHAAQTAFREQAFGSAIRPWIGYMFLLEDCPSSTKPVGVKEPHFKVFPEFRNSSYAKRYELFCRRLVLEKHYDCSAFLLSNSEKGLNGGYSEPAADLTFQLFANSLVAHVAAFSGRIKQL